MQHTTQHEPDAGICIVSVTGEVRRPRDSIKLQQLARDFGLENDCSRFIFDLREATIVGGTMEAFQVGTVPADTNHGQRIQMIALVYAGELSEHKFLENVAVNRGYNVRVFDDLDAAHAWVTSGRATP